MNFAPGQAMHDSQSAIHIDTASIPAHVRDDLAAATLDLIHGILRQPGGREALEARKRAKRAAMSAE